MEGPDGKTLRSILEDPTGGNMLFYAKKKKKLTRPRL